MPTSPPVKKLFCKLRRGDKFEYYTDDSKLKEAVVIEVISVGPRMTTVRVITEGGSINITKSSKYKVRLGETSLNEKDYLKPANRTRGTLIRGVSID